MSENTSNNMPNYIQGYIHFTSDAENGHHDFDFDINQSSIPSPAEFDFNTPIDRSTQDNTMHQQPQDNEIAPPAYCVDPFDPIHYEDVAQGRTAEEVFGHPVKLDTTLNVEALTHPAVANIFKPVHTINNLRQALDAASAFLNSSHARCTHRVHGVQCDRFR